MNWDAISAISTLVATLIILVTAVFAIMQLNEMKRSRRLELFMKLFEEYSSPQSRESRRYIYNELPREIDNSSIEDRMTESILMELRTVWGISRKRFYRRFGNDVEERLNLDQFEMFKDSGHLIDEDDRITLSDEGIYMVEEICRRLIK